jgi:hypothetical protein
MMKVNSIAPWERRPSKMQTSSAEAGSPEIRKLILNQDV